MGSPLDTAILAAGTSAPASWTKLDEIPFDFERRRVSVLAECGIRRALIVKGAPEEVLRLSDHYRSASGNVVPLNEPDRSRLEAKLRP